MDPLSYFSQQALNALPVAALYALLAFAYALTFGLTRRVDFTAGALFAFSGQVFVIFTAIGWTGLRLVYPAALAFGAVFALLYSALAGHVIASRLIAPVAARAPNAVVMLSLAVMIVLMETVRIAADSRDLWIAPVLNTHVIFAGSGQGTVLLTRLQIANTALMAGVVITGMVYLHRSAWGRDWRAVADDRLAARLFGIDDERFTRRSVLLTAILAASAGILATAYYGNMSFGAGLMFGLKVVMIAAIGDQLRPDRLAMGAAVYGVAETFWGAYLPFAWRDIALFAALVLLAVIFRRRERI